MMISHAHEPRLKRLKKKRRTLRIHRQLEIQAWREHGVTVQGGVHEVKALMLAAVGR